jgi:hypothetical protein
LQTLRVAGPKVDPFIRSLKTPGQFPTMELDGNEGAGFWFANGRNTFTRNSAADCGLGYYMQHFTATWYAFPIYPVQQPDGSFRDEDIRALPFVRFEGNEAHGCDGDGVRLDSGVPIRGEGPPQYADKTRPFLIRDLRLWDGNGFVSRVGVLRMENARIDKELSSAEEREAVKRGWPKLVDDLPPTTVITHVIRREGKVLVRGTTADNGVVRRVVVNGEEARSVGANFAEWEITLDGVPAGPLRLKACAEDAAKNVEPLPHTVTVAD